MNQSCSPNNSASLSRPLRVAVLVDLPRSAASGGHVKGWESRAKAVAASDIPLDLTIFFSGTPHTEMLSPNVRLKHLPPVFSTKNLSFLPYVPDHTDLAPYHPALAKELESFDVIHTTDGYFAFARTAERVSRKHGIPLVTSFHTDTPSYARIFTRNTLQTIFGKNRLSNFLIETCRIPEKQEQKMINRLKMHLSCCSDALLVRPEDAALAEGVLGKTHCHYLRVVSDKKRFNPERADKKQIEQQYNVPSGRFIALFVGRLDIGKNIYTLIEAVEQLIKKGKAIHLITAGLGPAAQDLQKRLGNHVTVAGLVDPDSLGQLMASCDVLSFPSEVEIRSFVSVEALASGLPVIVSEKSGIKQLIQAGDGLRSVSGGVEAWATTLEMLMDDPALVEASRKASINYAAEHIISWQECMAHDFLPVWQSAYDTIR